MKFLLVVMFILGPISALADSGVVCKVGKYLYQASESIQQASEKLNDILEVSTCAENVISISKPEISIDTKSPSLSQATVCVSVEARHLNAYNCNH